MRKIILSQRQSPGDILVFTRALGDLKMTHPDWLIDVRSPCQEIFENNPRITPLKDDDPEVEKFDAEYPDIHNSGWSGMHFTEGYYKDLEKKLYTKINRTGLRPEIWISDEERGWYNQVHCEFNYDGPFWVLNAGSKQDNELKQYHRWQEVVDLLNKEFDGKAKIVQVGDKRHVHPKLEGVLDLVGKTDVRQLIRLIYHAHGTIGPISFQMHISGAFQQPAVVVAGGKEPIRWEMYPNHRYLAVNGAILCAAWDGCWKGGPAKKCSQLIDGVPRCFRMIEPYMVSDAVMMYYKGGALELK